MLRYVIGAGVCLAVVLGLAGSGRAQDVKSDTMARSRSVAKTDLRVDTGIPGYAFQDSKANGRARRRLLPRHRRRAARFRPQGEIHRHHLEGAVLGAACRARSTC